MVVFSIDKTIPQYSINIDIDIITLLFLVYGVMNCKWQAEFNSNKAVNKLCTIVYIIKIILFIKTSFYGLPLIRRYV